MPWIGGGSRIGAVVMVRVRARVRVRVRAKIRVRVRLEVKVRVRADESTHCFTNPGELRTLREVELWLGSRSALGLGLRLLEIGVG